MLVQEDCPTYICGHHGHCLTHSRDPDGYALEAAHFPMQHWEVQQLDLNRGGEIGIQEASDLLTYL